MSASDTALMKPGSFFKNHQIKTKYGFDRVVEDLIQEAMSKGDFNNLQGMGKPLSHAQSQNPYVDFTQHKINKILLDNGFTPEWITLQKEIRTEIDELTNCLLDKRSYFGEAPLSENEYSEWLTIVQSYSNRVTGINKQIDKYNLIVPILDQQMVGVNVKRIADKILKTKPDIGKHRIVMPTKNEISKSEETDKKSLLSVLLWWM